MEENDMMIDKASMDLLKALYKKDLPEEKVNRIIGLEENDRPDKRLSLLTAEDMISRRMTAGVPDGEGGYVDETVKLTYHLEPNGRAAVEYAHSHLLEKILDWGSNILP